jgi:hypothetical protein
MKNFARFATATVVIAAGLGLAGLGAATDAQAQPGPFPQWCPRDFWDPVWGPNWDGGTATTAGGDPDRVDRDGAPRDNRDGDLVDPDMDPADRGMDRDMDRADRNGDLGDPADRDGDLPLCSNRASGLGADAVITCPA